MTSRFEQYETTETGAFLAQIITMPEMVAEYATLSRIGKPAVQAIAADVSPIIGGLATKQERDAANQFVGWRVAKIMRSLGYRLIQERGRVVGAPYRTGAVWSYEPGGVKIALSLPQEVTRRVQVLVKSARGEVLADIDAIDDGAGSEGRVRNIFRLGVPIDGAVELAERYAARHAFAYVHIIDGNHLLSIEQINRLVK